MSLAEALASITQADLDETNAKITELESQLDTQRELRRIIEIKLGVRKPQGAHLRGMKRKPKAASLPTAQDMGGSVNSDSDDDQQFTATEQHRMNARKWLLAQHNKATPVLECARQSGVPTGSTTNVFRHPWFQHTPNGVMLTHDGKAGVGL